MQFFKHMTGMRHDPKVKRLVRKYKSDGYAVYNWILESIADSISTENPLPVLEDQVEDLSYDLGLPEKRIEEIVNYCCETGLLNIVPGKGVVYCLKIYKFLNTSQTRSDRLRQMITAVSGSNTGQLEYNKLSGYIESSILSNSKELPEITSVSQTVCDNNDRKEEDIDIDIDKEKKEKKKIPSPSSKKFSSYSPNKKPSPSPSDFETFKSLSDQIGETIEHWNSKDNLPRCRYNITTLPNVGEVNTKFDVFGQSDIMTAIDYLSKYIDNEKYKPTSFDRFVTTSLDRWVEDAEPWKRYDDKTEVVDKISQEEISEFFAKN